MDIKELDKKQLILLTLITFVVSIATGIVTVSLMNQMPKSVPQTINNVIQRTIEKVKEVEVKDIDNSNSNVPIGVSLGDSDTLVPIYLKNTKILAEENVNTSIDSIGSGVIISDIGLILVDSNILKNEEEYKVILNKTEFSAPVLKEFINGFTILKISEIKDIDQTKSEENTTETEVDAQ